MLESGPKHIPIQDTQPVTELPSLSSLKPGEHREFIYNNLKLDLLLTKMSSRYDRFLKQPSSMREYVVSYQDTSIVQSVLAMFPPGSPMINRERFGGSVAFAGTSITKLPREQIEKLGEGLVESLEGIGRVLSSLGRDEIQDICTYIKKPIVHEVIRNPSMGLEKDKWDFLFSDELVGRGYIEGSPGVWIKTYEPNKI